MKLKIFIYLFTFLAPEDDELKDDQWLGVTVRSQGPGGYVLVITFNNISPFLFIYLEKCRICLIFFCFYI